MTPEALAVSHAKAFAGQSRGWSAAEFRALMDSAHVFITGDATAFAMGRVVAGEAEVLTLATVPEARRTGRGAAALRALEAEARMRGATRVFLEVAADNTAAIALYDRAGYAQIARREKYYTRLGGGCVDALILEKTVP